jgi:GDPmannose 4,6-dehydratase
MGNLDALRDWGHAKDYVEMQWLMLQQEEPDDFVIATGIQKSVREFIEISSKYLGWNKKDSTKGILWEGEGINEVGRRADTGEIVIRIDPRYFRPTEVQTLLGDPTKAKEKLGWEPSISLEEMIKEMIDNDIKESKKDSLLNKKGYNISTSIENPPNII